MVWPAVIAAGAAIAGGVLGNRAAAREASKARDFTADQYARRYRITMADMRQAGLNPMLAYSQGVGSSPTGAMAQQGDFGGGAAGNIIAQAKIRESQKRQADTQSEQNTATAKNLDQDTKLKITQERKTNAEINQVKSQTATEFQRQQHVGAQAALTTSQNRRIEDEIRSLAAKTSLTKDQQRLLKEEIIRMVRSGSGQVGKTIDDLLKSFGNFSAWSAKSISDLAEQILKSRPKGK